MNRCTFIGRLTRDPEIRYSNDKVPIARYVLAVRRSYQRDGMPEADFINVVAFSRHAEFVEKFLEKGQQIAIEARCQTGSYVDKEGITRYTTEFVVDNHFFTGSKATEDETQSDEESYSQIDNKQTNTKPTTQYKRKFK